MAIEPQVDEDRVFYVREKRVDNKKYERLESRIQASGGRLRRWPPSYGFGTGAAPELFCFR